MNETGDAIGVYTYEPAGNWDTGTFHGVRLQSDMMRPSGVGKVVALKVGEVEVPWPEGLTWLEAVIEWVVEEEFGLFWRCPEKSAWPMPGWWVVDDVRGYSRW